MANSESCSVPMSDRQVLVPSSPDTWALLELDFVFHFVNSWDHRHAPKIADVVLIMSRLSDTRPLKVFRSALC